MLLEITRGEVARRHPEDGILAAANHFTSPTLAARQKPFLLPHSVARAERLRALARRTGYGRGRPLHARGHEVSGRHGRGSAFREGRERGDGRQRAVQAGRGGVFIGREHAPPVSAGEFQRVGAEKLMGGG